ncbi:MAG TPA: hypothetical protein VG936_08150 [Lacunisphaera sp.]|nr:hypothetical protein [Lacunisphaera sp.]
MKLKSEFLLLMPALAIAAPAPVARTDPAEAKPYVLYMRTDLSVEQHNKLYPIKDVSGRDFIVSIDGRQVNVPTVGAGHRIEFGHALTLARASASLTDLVAERAYTPGADPRMQRERSAMTADAVIGDNASLATGKFIVAENKNFVALNTEDKDPITLAPVPLGSQQSADNLRDLGIADAAQADQLSNQAADLQRSNVTSGAFGRLAADNDMRQELFDAVSIRFTVSSENYLEKPYLVVITRFHTPDDKPGQARNAVYARALNPIGGKLTKIDVLQGGMPRGFEIEEAQVHLYNDGREIPTEVSPKRVPLSRDEAFEYLKIEYLAAHKGDTLTATAALGRPTKDQRLLLTPNQWKDFYYAKVSEDGVPVGTFTDEACTQPAEGPVGELAKNVRYYPALDKGRRVAGTARLRFAELPL